LVKRHGIIHIDYPGETLPIIKILTLFSKYLQEFFVILQRPLSLGLWLLKMN